MRTNYVASISRIQVLYTHPKKFHSDSLCKNFAMAITGVVSLPSPSIPETHVKSEKHAHIYKHALSLSIWRKEVQPSFLTPAKSIPLPIPLFPLAAFFLPLTRINLTITLSLSLSLSLSLCNSLSLYHCSNPLSLPLPLQQPTLSPFTTAATHSLSCYTIAKLSLWALLSSLFTRSPSLSYGTSSNLLSTRPFPVYN
ncbi:hypothetical protein AMTRI_Chr13g123460 [Amborella trichopoda]